MRRFALSALLVVLPFGALADDVWVPLKGGEVRMALEERKLRYSNATQVFYASGKTLYNFGGRDSWGYWRVEDDHYCSQWPPNDLWACYGLEAQGARLRFVGKGNDISHAEYAD